MILSLNIGTSSGKAALFTDSAEEISREIITPVDNISEVVQKLINECSSKASVSSETIKKFGVRIVHGGQRYTKPTLITSEVMSYLSSIESLAPLHNPVAMKVIETLQEHYPEIPIVGVFDTAFHATMPQQASDYAVPPEWKELYQVQRYGFHGLAHASMLKLFCDKKSILPMDATIITVQLGSGCSICAIKNGVSVDTSMGFSPIEGLISRTRCGDIDVSLVGYLSQKIGISAQEIITLLNKESGLKALSHTDGNMANIQNAIKLEDKHARVSVELFIYRIQKYLGSYDAVLQGAQAIILGGGISEHCPDIIQGIFSNPFFKVSVESYTDSRSADQIIKISRPDSPREAYVAFVNEEREIALGVIENLNIKH